MDQDLCEFTRSEDELWYQINVVVPVPTELGGNGLVWAEFAIELGEAGMTKGNGYLIDEIRLVEGDSGRTWVRLRDALSPP